MRAVLDECRCGDSESDNLECDGKIFGLVSLVHVVPDLSLCGLILVCV